jgi:hypothetical protein
MNGDPTKDGAFFVGCAFMRTWFNDAFFCRRSSASAEVAMNGDPTRIGAFFVGCAFMRTWFNDASFCRGSCASAEVAMNGDPTKDWCVYAHLVKSRANRAAPSMPP